MLIIQHVFLMMNGVMKMMSLESSSLAIHLIIESDSMLYRIE